MKLYKSIFSLFLLSSVLFFTACDDDDDSTPVVTSSEAVLEFKANYDGTPLVMTDSYTYAEDMPVFFTKLQFYVSNIALVNADGSTLELSELENIDFSTVTSLNDAEDGIRRVFSSVPVGTYTALRLGIGVASDLNATSPSDYSTSHPLSENYWSAWESYIFAKIEGKADLAQDGEFSQSFTYHTGSDELYKEYSFAGPIEVSASGTTLPTINLDVKKLLMRSDSDYIDIEVHNAVHNDIELMRYMMDNFGNAMN